MSITKTLALFTAAFLFCCAPLLWIGGGENPAYVTLQKAGAVPDIAIIGDSRAHVTLSPREMRAEFTRQGVPGLTVQNFAVDGTDALHHWSFAHSALLSGPRRPRVIVWASNPLQFDESRHNNRLEYLRLADARRLVSVRAPLELVLDVITMGLFRPWAHRPVFKTMLSDYSERLGIRTLSLETKVLGLKVEKEELSRVYADGGDGWVPFRVLQWKDRFARGAATYAREYEALRLSEWHFALVKDFAAECAKHGVQLVVVEMPLSPWFREHLAVKAVHRQWRDRMMETLSENGATFFNHGAFMLEAKDEDFGDPAHMPEDLAMRYSTRFTNVLLDGGVLGFAPAQSSLTGDL
jgi:hypothetical protein